MFRKGFEYIDEPYKTVLSMLLDSLLQIYGDIIISLVVFGSVARGDYKRDSDVDLLLIMEEVRGGISERIKKFELAEDNIQEELDKLFDEGVFISFSPIILSEEEARKFRPIYLDMVEDAIILYDENGFFESILYRLRERLEELGAERVWIGNKWYWRLKRDYKFGEVIKIEL